jgi:uncharacterized protein (DUF1684 family)
MRKAWLQILPVFLIHSISFSIPATAGVESEEYLARLKHRQEIIDWRSNRETGLAREGGWLSLVGLEWVREGENRVGSADGNDVLVPGGAAYWGSVFLEEGALRFVRANDDSVTIDGQYLDEAPLVADTEGEPTVVQSGSLNFFPIFRESYALRIRDIQAPARLNFHGVESYEIDPEWRIDGHVILAEEGRTIEIANVLGQVSDLPVYGTLEFERDGETHRLTALGDGESKSLWFIFHDRTNSRGTYGAGRFLYSDGMPREGRLVVDFNKAYNPPCAFNDYSTCPLPPQENRLDLAVTAGEKDFHADQESAR